jgi:hypothetical protein
LLAEVLVVCASIRHALRHLPSWMKPKRVPVSFELKPGRGRILYQPVGVVGIISPWNYPFQLSIMPLIGALAAGNRVMLKPSELAPRTAEFIAELLEHQHRGRARARYAPIAQCSMLPSADLHCARTLCRDTERLNQARVVVLRVADPRDDRPASHPF